MQNNFEMHYMLLLQEVNAIDFIQLNKQTKERQNSTFQIEETLC